MTRIVVEVELSPLPPGYCLVNVVAITTMTRHQLGIHRRIHQPPHDCWTASTHHIALFLFLPRTRIRTLEDPQSCQLMGSETSGAAKSRAILEKLKNDDNHESPLLRYLQPNRLILRQA